MEDRETYGTPNYLEKVQSQLPALQLLTELGWGYLTPEECVSLRGGRLGSAITIRRTLGGGSGSLGTMHSLPTCERWRLVSTHTSS